MVIRKVKEDRWQIDVADAKALEGFKRIRKNVTSEEEAKRVHDEVLKSLQEYGKWPVGPKDKPLVRTTGREKTKTGNLRQVAQIALDYHWKGTPYEGPVSFQIWPMVEWFEDHGCANIDDITSYHLDKFVAHRREKNNTPNTINKYLSILGVLNTLALERKPPLCKSKLPIKRLKVARMEKWWLKPDSLARLVEWLNERGDTVFADLVQIICYQGFRIEEALRLRERHFTGLGTENPWVQVPGTKTQKSGRTIPVYTQSFELVDRSIKRARTLGWSTLFNMTPRQSRELWNECREFLGVGDVKTATLKALRRTFASYATKNGMPTRTLQDVMGHETITTTEGYLDLVGSGRTDDSRKFMNKEPKEEPKASSGSVIAEAIKAYVSTGATAEQVAIFAKELMK